MPGAILLGAGSGIPTDLLVKAGDAAGIVAILALLLVLPLFLTHRREVNRLLEWQRLEPGRGEGADEAAGDAAAATGAATATTGRPMSPAQRVTADRPAIERITAERAAIESPSFWRRLIARGPRHPLVLAGLALLLAVGAVLVVSLTGSIGDNEPDTSGRFDRTAVSLVVLNGSSKTALADKVADSLSAAGFEDVRTGTTAPERQTVVFYDKGQRRAAEVLRRELGVNVVQRIDRARQAAAPEADVVVVAGEDYARA
jgi:hypothetical protein